MEITLTNTCSSLTQPFIIPSSLKYKVTKISFFGFKSSHFNISCCASPGLATCSAGDRIQRISSLESLFCYDKAIPEQIIETPIGLSIAEKEIGDKPSCCDCHAKGAVICSTCGGSGLYVDSVMECQGIIVKVRCLGCGGTGNIMCSECGGRGHL